jgi:hypothetical protein
MDASRWMTQKGADALRYPGTRIVITASLGKYPESSISPKMRKKQPTMGRMIAIA